MLTPAPTMESDRPKYRPQERFWPYAELPEQPTEEELAALDPDLHDALVGAPPRPPSGPPPPRGGGRGAGGPQAGGGRAPPPPPRFSGGAPPTPPPSCQP